MIKIKLYELDKHRNECTFRPFLFAQNTLREIGIEFTTGDSYDFAWIAQASFLNKKVSLEQSVNDGLEYLSNITGDYMLIDGQDSASLIGAYEVFKQSKALLLLKSSLYKDRSLYSQGLQLGRYYWGPGEYKLEDFDKYSNRIMISGTNWIATHYAGIQKQWYDHRRAKEYDISAMFQYPSPDIYEHGQLQSKYYDEFRKKGIDIINNLPYKVAKLENGNRVSIEEYYNRMFNSKIIFAPFGFGEMAPRDMEAAMFGSILIKPDMSHIETAPNIYVDNETYISCKHDFSDLEEKINMILGNYENYTYIIENARKKIVDSMNPEHLALHLYQIFSNLETVTT
jgi:hypothetical protein